MAEKSPPDNKWANWDPHWQGVFDKREWTKFETVEHISPYLQSSFYPAEDNSAREHIVTWDRRSDQLLRIWEEEPPYWHLLEPQEQQFEDSLAEYMMKNWGREQSLAHVRRWSNEKRDEFIRDKLEKCLREHCNLKVLWLLHKTWVSAPSTSAAASSSAAAAPAEPAPTVSSPRLSNLGQR